MSAIYFFVTILSNHREKIFAPEMCSTTFETCGTVFFCPSLPFCAILSKRVMRKSGNFSAEDMFLVERFGSKARNAWVPARTSAHSRGTNLDHDWANENWGRRNRICVWNCQCLADLAEMTGLRVPLIFLFCGSHSYCLDLGQLFLSRVVVPFTLLNRQPQNRGIGQWR